MAVYGVIAGVAVAIMAAAAEDQAVDVMTVTTMAAVPVHEQEDVLTAKAFAPDTGKALMMPPDHV